METAVLDEQVAAFEKQERERLDKEYADKLEAQVASIQEENKKVIAEAIDKIRKEMAPPTAEDVEKLLAQEYVEFEIEIPVGGKNGKKRKFIIRELPQKVEKKIFKTVKDLLVPFSSEISALSMNFMEGDASKKLVQIMSTFEPMLDVMVAVCTICLNPYGEEEDVNEEWVASNLSATRIMKIVTAQAQCNRIRDFLSLLFAGSKQMIR